MGLHARTDPAIGAPIESGDTIIGVNGAPLQSWNQLRLKVIDASLSGAPLLLGIERAGQRLDLILATQGAMSADLSDRDPLQVLGLSLAPGEVLIGSLVAGEPAIVSGLRVGDRVKAIEAGAADFVVKPFKQDDVLAVVAHARAEQGELPLALAGFSFGAFVTSQALAALAPARPAPHAVVAAGLEAGSSLTGVSVTGRVDIG